MRFASLVSLVAAPLVLSSLFVTGCSSDSGGAVADTGVTDDGTSTFRPDDGVDSGAADTGMPDMGPMDATDDTSAADSGATDSGTSDSGATDSGVADSGVADSGAGDVATGPQTIDVQVGAGGMAFVPSAVNIHVGDTVRWTWAASFHNVVSGTGGVADGKFCSPNDTSCATSPLGTAGDVYTHTFTQAGSFPYFCRPHAAFGMTGTVTVAP